MADGQGNINRPNTGTVPKIKYSNNAMAIHSSKDQSKSPRMSNNLVRTSLLPTVLFCHCRMLIMPMLSRGVLKIIVYKNRNWVDCVSKLVHSF